MEFNYAQKQARRCGRNKIILYLVLSAIVVILFAGNNVSLQNLYGRAETFSGSSAMVTLYENGERFVGATAEVLFDTGYYMTSDGKREYNYYAYWDEDCYVIVRAGAKFTGDEFYDYKISGKLESFNSTEREIRYEIAEEIVEMYSEEYDLTHDEGDSLIAPYLVDIAGNGRLWEQILVTGGIVLLAAFLALILKAGAEMSDYTKAKSFRKMDMGGSENPDRVNEELSREFEKEEFLIKLKGNVLTRGYFTQETVYGWQTRRRRDIVWIYKQITQHRTNGIPTGKTFALILTFVDGKTVTVPTQKRNADDLIASFAAACPHAVTGYSDEIRGMFHKDRAKFEELRAELEKRREAASAETPENN